MTILQLVQGSPEWLAFKWPRIGASAIGDILAGNIPSSGAFGTKYSQWARLTGKLTETKDEPTDAMRWGLDSEPLHRKLIGRELGCEVLQGPVVQDDGEPLFMASLDAVLYRNGPAEIVELKAPSNWPAKRWQDEGPPLAHKLQWLWQAYVSRHDLNASHGMISALIPPRPLWERQERSTEKEEWVAGQIHEFVQKHVLTDIPPEATGDDMEVIKRMYPKDSGRVVILPPEFVEISHEERKIAKTIKDLEGEQKDMRAKIQAFLGDATFGVVEDGFVWKYRTQEADYQPQPLRVVKSRPLVKVKGVG